MRTVRIKFAWPEENFSIRKDNGKTLDNKFVKVSAPLHNTAKDLVMSLLSSQIKKHKELGTYKGQKVKVTSWHNDDVVDAMHPNGQPHKVHVTEYELDFTQTD